jgi:hypothetical protein
MATNGIAGRERERERPAHNTETKSAKLEQLHSTRLIYHDPKATNSTHVKASNKITYQAYQQLLLITFKHGY